MSEALKQNKRWFLKVELAVLVCVICIWIVKPFTDDIDSAEAAVLKQLGKIDSNDAHAHNLLGNAYCDLSNYGKGSKWLYEKSIHNPDMHYLS